MAFEPFGMFHIDGSSDNTLVVHFHKSGDLFSFDEDGSIEELSFSKIGSQLFGVDGSSYNIALHDFANSNEKLWSVDCPIFDITEVSVKKRLVNMSFLRIEEKIFVSAKENNLTLVSEINLTNRVTIAKGAFKLFRNVRSIKSGGIE